MPSSLNVAKKEPCFEESLTIGHRKEEKEVNQEVGNVTSKYDGVINYR
jgi:hypothetical protein